MKKYLNIMMLAFSFVLFLYSLSFSQEQITITTYYPSPYGSYKELRADQMAIGSSYRSSTLADGNLLVSGNVGIGTAAPLAKLQINATSTTDALRINNGGLIVHEFTMDSSGNGIQLIYNSSGVGSVRLDASSGGFSYISNGNVGIGTNNPQAKLDVNGDINVINLAVRNCVWSAGFRESNGTPYICPASTPLMSGRQHWGDENGDTRYYCCTL